MITYLMYNCASIHYLPVRRRRRNVFDYRTAVVGGWFEALGMCTVTNLPMLQVLILFR